MSYLDHHVRITPISPPHSYYYQNELGSSSWLKHLATTTQLSQSFPRAKAVPLPHLHHHDMAKVSPSNKYQKVTSVLALHNKHDIEAKVALKSFQQEVTPSSSDHLPKIFPSCDYSTDNLLSLNQSLSSPSFSDNKAEFSPFLSHGSMTEKGIYPDFQGKDKLSVISMNPGNQTKVARRPQSQIRPTTATTLGNLDLKHTASVTSSSLCFHHWSKATASKTPELDHWVQAKASKMSYPDLHLRDTVSLLRCIDHHSRPLTDYSLHLNQKTRATTTKSSCPKRCIKGKALPSPAPNHQARTRATSSQGVKSWDKGLANHWVTAAFPLHHQMYDVPVKQASSQCTLHHQATCPPTPEYYQAKYVTDPNTHILLQKEKKHTEVMPQDLDYQFTMLTGQVYWSTSSVNMEYNDTASFDYDQSTTTPFSPRYQTESELDPQPQIALQTERKNDWERISVGSDYEVTHVTGQDQWATPSQGVRNPKHRTVSGPEHQTISLSSNDHQTEDIAVDSNTQVIFQQELDKWETYWMKDQKSSHPSSVDHQAQEIQGDPRDSITFQQELEKWKIQDPKLTPTSISGHQAEAIPADHKTQVIFHQEPDEWETIWEKGQNHQSISPANNDQQDQNMPEDPKVNIILKGEPHDQDKFCTARLDHQPILSPGNDHQIQDMPADHNTQVIFHQEEDKHETFWTQEQNHQSTPPLNNDYQVQDTPEDPSAHVTLKQELENLDTFWTKGLDQQPTSPPGNKQEDEDKSDFNSKTTLQQKIEEWKTLWPGEPDKQGTILTNQVYLATSTLDLKYQDETSPETNHGGTSPPSCGEQASDVAEFSIQATLQQKIGKMETFWPIEPDKQATTVTDQDYWATSPWDIKHQGRISPDLHHGVTPLITHEDQDSDVPDLSPQVTLQQELGKREIFWPIELDKQATIPKDQEFWATSPWDIKQQDRTSPDLHHGATPLPTHEDEDSDVSDLSAQVTLQQELGKRETFWQTELDKQATTLKDQNYWVTTLWNMKHQDRTSPDLHHVSTSLPTHEDEDSDVSDLSAQVTPQQELGKRETFWPIKLDKQATTLKGQDYWVTTLWDMKQQDRTSPDLHHRATPLPTHEDEDSDVSDLSDQVTLQQELGKRETFWQTELDKEATTLKDQNYWVTTLWNMKHQDRTSPDLHHVSTSLPTHEDEDSDVSDLSDQVILQQELGERGTFWPREPDKQIITLKDQDYWATSPWDIKHQDRTSPDLHHGATPLSRHKDQDSDVSDLNEQVILQQKLGKRKTSCPTEPDKQVTTLTDQDYWATFPWDIKHQDRISLDHHHGATPPLSHEDQDSDATDLSPPTTLQQELSKKETSCPTELDKQVTNLTDKDYWATSPWDIKHQDRKSLNFHHKDTALSSHGDKTSNISDLSAHAILQQEQGKRETFWSTELDQQATTLTDKVYWTAPTLDLNHEDRFSLDFHHEATHPPRNEVQDSDTDDLSGQATLQQELGKKETSCPTEVDQQAITLTDEVCWAKLPWDIKHQDRIFPDPYVEVTSPPSHKDQDSDVSELSTQTINQPELNEWKTFWPREVNQQVTTLTDKVYWATPMLDQKYLDRTSPDLHHETTSPSSYEEQDSDFIYLSSQATLQQELGKRETSCLTELDQQARTLKDKVSWATLSWDRTSLATPHEPTSPPRHEDDSSAISDPSAQSILQEELDKWKTSCPTELDQQARTLKDEVSWETLSWDRTSPYQPTSPPRHEDDSSAISDLSAQSILQEELDKWKTSCPTELDQQARTLKDEVSWATSPWEIKHPGRNSPDNHLESTSSSNHDYQDSDLSDFSTQETLQLGINEWEKLWPTELDQEGTTLPDQASWAISPWDIKQQDRTSLDTDHTTSTSSSQEKKDGDVPDPNAETIPQPKLDQWEITPSALDPELRVDLTIQHSRTVPSMSIIESQNMVLSDPEHQIMPPFSNDYSIGDISKPNSKITFQQGQDDWDIFWTRLDHQDTASLNNDNQVQHIPGPKADIIQKEQEDLDIFWTRTLKYPAMTPTNQDYWTAFPLLNIEHHNMIQPNPDHQASCTTSPDHQAGDTTDSNVQSIFQTKKKSWETMPQEIEHKTLILTAHDQEAIFLLGKTPQDTNLPSCDNQDFILSIHDTEDTDVPGPNTLVTIQPEKGHWELIPPETDHMAIISFTVHQQEATPSLTLNHNDTNPSNSIHWAATSLII